jgi:hypothetical protein
MAIQKPDSPAFGGVLYLLFILTLIEIRAIFHILCGFQMVKTVTVKTR